MAASSHTRSTHCNGRRVEEALCERARLCVWYVEEDAQGNLSRQPYWAVAHNYDPARGLQVWFDDARSEDDCEWIDEGDDWADAVR